MALFSNIGRSFSNITKNISSSKVLASSLVSASRPKDKTVFVELDQKPAKAKVVREGFQVPSVRPDKTRVDTFFSGLDIVTPRLSPRVVNQSITPGTKVPVGTEIDLRLANPIDVPIQIFDDIHTDVVTKNVGEILDQVVANKELQDLVLKYEDADQVDETDKARMTTLLESTADIAVDEAVAGKGFRNGFNAVRTVLAFK